MSCASSPLTSGSSTPVTTGPTFRARCAHCNAMAEPLCSHILTNINTMVSVFSTNGTTPSLSPNSPYHSHNFPRAFDTADDDEEEKRHLLPPPHGFTAAALMEGHVKTCEMNIFYGCKMGRNELFIAYAEDRARNNALFKKYQTDPRAISDALDARARSRARISTKAKERELKDWQNHSNWEIMPAPATPTIILHD